MTLVVFKGQNRKMILKFYSNYNAYLQISLFNAVNKARD